MWALACFGGESLNDRPSRLFLSVRRLAWRAAIDWTFRAYRDPPTVPLLCAVTAHKSVSRRVGDERFGSTSFDSVAAV